MSQGQSGLGIRVVKASAEAPTALAAFDGALLAAGVANHNLLYLSSIIPAGSTVTKGRPSYKADAFGDRLYCVMAAKRTTVPGVETWAGLGWVQEQASGRGLFAEIEGESRGEVCFQLEATLSEMMRRRPEYEWGEMTIVTEGTRCLHQPVCSLVAAVYLTEPWERR